MADSSLVPLNREEREGNDEEKIDEEELDWRKIEQLKVSLWFDLAEIRVGICVISNQIREVDLGLGFV